MKLTPKALTKAAFAAYGQVVETLDARSMPINQGLTTRYHDLFRIDVSRKGGHPIGSVFRTRPLPLPHRVTIMERHPLGSQAFIPLDEKPFLVLVGSAGESLTAEDLELFLTNGRQGVNIYRNTWHHFNIALGKTQDFLVIDRGGPGRNLDEIEIQGEAWIDSVHDS